MIRRDTHPIPPAVPTALTADIEDFRVPDLPSAEQLGPPNFRWGSLDGISFSLIIDKAYEENCALEA